MKQKYTLIGFFISIFLSNDLNFALAYPDHLSFPNEIITTTQAIDYTARKSITAGPAYQILNGADVTFNSEKVVLKPGFHLVVGGKLAIRTNPWTTYNIAPVAMPDSMNASKGGNSSSILTNGATSLLTNDYDEEGDPFIASLQTGASHGTLTLNPDGTFYYSHDGSDFLSDSFTYSISDTLNSNITTVSITVIPPDITKPATTATLTSGIYPAPVSVDILCSELAVIYYTTDGSIPDINNETTISSGQAVTSVQGIAISQTTQLRFFAVDRAENQEEIMHNELYIINSNFDQQQITPDKTLMYYEYDPVGRMKRIIRIK